jgi:hypothetical protein
MGALLQLPVAKHGSCIVKPEKLGLVTESSVALLLLEQPQDKDPDYCTCHAADLRSLDCESRILITDCEGVQHVFRVQTSALQKLLELGFLKRMEPDGLTCTKLQGVILKTTERGNAHAAMLREVGRFK